MSTPSEKAERLYAMFDSYCKTVIRNLGRNSKRTRANRLKHETVGKEDTQYLFDLLGYEDTYHSEHLILYAGKFSCVISNETLYKAILSLPEQQQIVLILDFWYDWTDEKISEYIRATPRTVYNLRQRAFKKIRGCYGQKKSDT